MELHGKPGSPRGGEHPSDLLGRERNRLADRIDCVRQPRSGEVGNHCSDLVDESVPVATGFGWQRMSAKKARDNLDLPDLWQSPRHTKHLCLGFIFQAITRFDLD